jgi:hypothetical protein
MIENTFAYPQQQHFNPVTLEPINDISRRRVENLRENAPELFEPGQRLIDIGCARGYICHLVRDKYNHIEGWEPSDLATEAQDLVTAASDTGLAANIKIHRGFLSDIPVLLSRTLKNNFTTVFIGDCHHYFTALGQECDVPWLWVQKIKALSNKYIVIDGPFTTEDFAVQSLINEHKWPQALIEQYTIKHFKQLMAPQFEPVRIITNERGTRQTTVWKRVYRDCSIDTVSDNFLQELRENGTNIKTDYREPYSVIKYKNFRYKFDGNELAAGLIMILNSLPWFPAINLMQNENKEIIGDICPWIDLPKPARFIDLLPMWIKMNRALSTVNLFEPAFKLTDYCLHDKFFIDLDYDMIGNRTDYLKNTEYKNKWKASLSNSFLEELFNLK